MTIDVKIPHYSTVSRRQMRLSLAISCANKQSPRDIVIDSTELKVYGDGEWKVRKHGHSKRRTWRKVHLTIYANSHELVGCVVTTNDVGDSGVFDELLEQIEDSIKSVPADGAYDTRKIYKTIRDRDAKALIPPRKGAII